MLYFRNNTLFHCFVCAQEIPSFAQVIAVTVADLYIFE